MALADVIKTALDQIKYIANTETVIGKPISAGDVTLIPVSKVSVGFAAGGAGDSEKNSGGSGTGGGVNVTPIAFISVIGDNIQVHPLTPSDPFFDKILSSAPDLVSKVSNFLKKGKKEKETTEKEKKTDTATSDDSESKE
jgi:uncharacterized spore protein YtfJ